MSELPVRKDELKQAIEEIIDTNDTMGIVALHTKLETKFNLKSGELSNHRTVINSLMDEYIASNAQQTVTDDFEDLDSYISNNLNNSANNNNNRNKKNNREEAEPSIMDINYTNSKNSDLFEIYQNYSIMLNQTDITYGQKGHNKYYAIQLLKHRHGSQFKFITKWGRVGNRPQTNEEIFDSQTIAIRKFRKKFKDKTKNEFGNKDFKAVKGKYIPIAMHSNNANTNSHSHSDSDSKSEFEMNENNSETENEVPMSKLHKSLVRILKIIFCKQLQSDTAKTFGFDINRMPLGQLSKSQIEKGYNILCKINTILCSNRNSASERKKLADLTNKYYTIIPHSFGMRLPPKISSLKRLHKEIELIEILRQMLFTNRILKKRFNSKTRNPIDVHYSALKCNLSRITPLSAEFKNIKKSIIGTHAQTHNRYELTVLDMFECDRQGSQFRHLPFQSALKTNKKLLFHGSRLSNFVGILSQGLRIAPPNAPKTGYMFGKGIYFADCASKSANYIHATERHPFGILIVCEVALGNMHCVIEANEDLQCAPKGYHSVKGMGKNIPKPNGNDNVTEWESNDGYKLSLGPLIANENENVNTNGSLLYNEYIVYDVGQVRMKYIVLTRFDFKS